MKSSPHLFEYVGSNWFECQIYSWFKAIKWETGRRAWMLVWWLVLPARLRQWRPETETTVTSSNTHTQLSLEPVPVPLNQKDRGPAAGVRQPQTGNPVLEQKLKRWSEQFEKIRKIDVNFAPSNATMLLLLNGDTFVRNMHLLELTLWVSHIKNAKSSLSNSFFLLLFWASGTL